MNRGMIFGLSMVGLVLSGLVLASWPNHADPEQPHLTGITLSVGVTPPKIILRFAESISLEEREFAKKFSETYCSAEVDKKAEFATIDGNAITYFCVDGEP